MVFRPSLRSIWTLISMAVVCYGLFLWADYSRVEVKQPHYAEKLAASQLMDSCLQSLADYHAADSEARESYGDPKLDVLVGQQFSTITTDIGSFEAKLHGLNPNFAGAVVQTLLDAGLSRGDEVAVALTGSNPGANLAVLSACQVLGIRTNTISAIGSTWWGANDPAFTWVDMQKILLDKKLLVSKPVAASRGGLDDNATGMSGAGRAELETAAARVNLRLLTTAASDQSGAVWWSAFKSALERGRYAAYINVGEGVASTGHSENGRLLTDGLHRRMPSRNWPARGAMHLAAESGVPVVHFYDMTRVSRLYGLGAPRIPLREPGYGEVFASERYDVRVAAVALFIALACLFILVRIDAKYFRLADAGVDPDTLL